MKGKLYLIPTPLGEHFSTDSFGKEYMDCVLMLKYFIVEELKTARRFLKKINPSCRIDDITFFILNEHTREKDFENFLQYALSGNNIGLLSEAGCPGIADPGAQVVRIAHKNQVQVVPLTGPSSITLALMSSGLNGQNFSFAGYLPVKPEERKAKLLQIEKRSKLENQTQIFIETPYRNISLLTDIIKYCNPNTLLCIASNLTQPDQFIRTLNIASWKNNLPDIHKKPAVFLIMSV